MAKTSAKSPARTPDWYYHRNGCTACAKASGFLAANGIEPAVVVPASKKLGRGDAEKLARDAATVIVAKNKQVAEWKTGGKAPTSCIEAMLGPTGNLRAPTLRVGKTVLVGFDEESYRAALL